ncbi:TetR/AcrR family transcriptional regulator [Streptomyces pinistramenti]|uniref:TetR/AcrR family transcriptional regulator n=1 Tax=Streptomyces pinistramenti TaxID=2884812 RepID=UPI001D085C50|nr:TetR/AcrR family transcriptional regulator [Streptomyces pinistramenti]MCB5906397.1 TetR/AcrR family transcriptional regulator [Streptomyces pinistramenti]
MCTQPTATGNPAAERPRSRKGEGDRLRGEILDAVNRLLVEWGSTEKLTIRAVAKEVGVSAPSLYLHFSDKTEMIWEALADKYRDLADQMRAADENTAREPGADTLAGLRAQVHTYCRFALRAPGQYRLMYEMRQPAVDAGRIGRHPARLVSERFREAVTRCKNDGYRLTLPVEQLAQTLWAGLHGNVALTHSLFPDASAEQLVLGLADGLLDSMIHTQDAALRKTQGDENSRVVTAIRTILGTAEAPEQSDDDALGR